MYSWSQTHNMRGSYKAAPGRSLTGRSYYMDKLPATVKYPRAFKRAPPANYDGVFDWEFLLPAFNGTNIRPTDLDAIVERFLHVLILETKAPSVVVPVGQRILLEAMVRIGQGNVCVMVVHGKVAPDIASIEEWHWDVKERRICKFKKACNSADVFKRVSIWFQWANGNIRNKEWETRWRALWLSTRLEVT